MTEEIIFDGDYYVSGEWATFRVTLKVNRIVKAAPIARKFEGQHIRNLLAYFVVDKIERIR